VREAVAAQAARALQDAFGRQPDRVAYAPGRVNLIGEHTDYNEGWVLPLAIDRGTAVAAASRDDRRIRAVSVALSARGSFELDALAPGRGWLDYLQGVVAAFAEEALPLRGLDLAVASDLPREAGLSSSASLEVAAATLFAASVGASLGAEDCARLAHGAETRFVGVPCGRMDQLASALGVRDRALCIDCRDFSRRYVPLPGERLRLLVADSGVRRQLAAGDYARRRAECEEGLARARDAGLLPPDARAWRDVGSERLPALGAALPAALLRRARHVITENGRVGETCRALEAGQLEAVGALLRDGMRSLRDDFEVSCPELDALCALGDAAPGCYGSRLTGAGFGGCTLHLVAAERVGSVAEALRLGFAERFARELPVLEVRASDGARLLALP
jgi:galactokinase